MDVRTDWEMGDCPVCCEKYSKRIRKPVGCAYCEYAACRECTSRYLLDKCVDASCMNCKRIWGTQFLLDAFTKTWVHGEWRAHVSKMLMEHERSRLPQTQEERLPGYKLYSENATALEENGTAISKLRRQMIELERRYFALTRQQNILVRTGYLSSTTNGDAIAPSSKRRRSYFACTVDGCRGLVDGTWKCGVCSAAVCDRCRAVLPPASSDGEAPTHECDPGDVKTFDLLRRDTRPCPNCHVPVTKTEGCDQMWCTACDKAWSWASGTLIRGEIHNPYYFEFLSRQGQHGRIDDFGNATDPPPRADDVGAPVCADGQDAMRLPHDSVIQVALSRLRTEHGLYGSVDETKFRAVMQRIRHLLLDTLPLHRDKVAVAGRDKYEERLRFLTNEITRKDFEDLLYAEEKKRIKSADYIQIAETFLLTTSPAVSKAIVAIAHRACTEVVARRVMSEALEVYEAAAGFCDDAILKLNRQWNASLPPVSVRPGMGDVRVYVRRYE